MTFKNKRIILVLVLVFVLYIVMTTDSVDVKNQNTLEIEASEMGAKYWKEIVPIIIGAVLLFRSTIIKFIKEIIFCPK